MSITNETDCVRKEGEGVTIIGLIVWYEIDFIQYIYYFFILCNSWLLTLAFMQAYQLYIPQRMGNIHIFILSEQIKDEQDI